MASGMSDPVFAYTISFSTLSLSMLTSLYALSVAAGAFPTPHRRCSPKTIPRTTPMAATRARKPDRFKQATPEFTSMPRSPAQRHFPFDADIRRAGLNKKKRRSEYLHRFHILLFISMLIFFLAKSFITLCCYVCSAPLILKRQLK